MERFVLDLGWGRISVFENVYEPSDDTWLLLDLLNEYRGFSRTCIETCSGTGIHGIYLLITGKCGQVVFVDANPAACLNTLHNIRLNNLVGRGVVLNSYSLKPFRERTGVNLIVFNPPYLPGVPWDVYDMGLVGGRKGYETIADILADASRILCPGGRLFFVYSSLTDRDMVMDVLARNGFKIVKELRKHVFFEDIYAAEAVLVEDKGCASRC